MSRRHRASAGDTVRECWGVRQGGNGLMHEVLVLEHVQDAAPRRYYTIATRGPLCIPRVGGGCHEVPFVDQATRQEARYSTRAAAVHRAMHLTMALGGRMHEGRWVIATTAPLPEGSTWERWDPQPVPPWAPDFLADLEAEPQVGAELHWIH